MRTKAENKVDLGAATVFFCGLGCLLLCKYLGFGWEILFVFFGFSFVGFRLILNNTETIIELVPERRYKLLHYSDEYATLEYRDAYETKTVHTFKYVKFYSWDPNGKDLSHKPTIGHIYTACKKKENDSLILKEIED